MRQAIGAIRLLWLGVVGVCLVMIGLVLGYAKWSKAYPGLIILAGCAACAIVLLVNEVASSRSSR